MSKTFSNRVGRTEEFSVECPAKTQVISGGYLATTELLITKSTFDKKGWSVVTTNQGKKAADITITAVCSVINPRFVKLVENKEQVPAGVSFTSKMVCPKDMVPIISGYTMPNDGSLKLGSISRDEKSYTYTVQNSTDKKQKLSFSMICMPNLSGTQSHTDTTYDLKAQELTTLTMKCAQAKAQAVDALIKLPGNVNLIGSQPIFGNWEVTLFNAAKDDVEVKVSLFCYQTR